MGQHVLLSGICRQSSLGGRKEAAGQRVGPEKRHREAAQPGVILGRAEERARARAGAGEKREHQRDRDSENLSSGRVDAPQSPGVQSARGT